jgi:hypothetical protein
VAAAFFSVLQGLANQTPVVIAVVDMQWLDSSSGDIVRCGSV